MKSILQLESVAYVGELSPEVDRISKKLANVYNYSYNAENISESYASGINFNFCNETKNLKKEYCENDKVLKVYLNKQDYFAIPGLFSGKNTYDKFYSSANIVFENFSLKDNLVSNINKGVVLEAHDISNESSIINEFSYIFEALEENNEINEISFKSIKDKFSSAKEKASEKLKNWGKEEWGSLTGEKTSGKDFNKIIDNLIKIQDAKSNKDPKVDRTAEDFGMSDHLKSYINTTKITSDELLIDGISEIFTEYFYSNGTKSDAQKALSDLLKKVNKSKDFRNAKQALMQFINSKKENDVSGLIVSAKQIQNKLQEIYENLSDPEYDRETATKSSSESNASKKANKAFAGAASIKKLEAAKKDIKKKLEKEGFFKKVWSWFEVVVAAAFNFISLLYKNKTKSIVASSVITGISKFLVVMLNKTTHFIIYLGKLAASLVMRAFNMNFENMESLDKLASEADGQISSFLESFFTLSVEVITNPVYIMKDHIDVIQGAVLKLAQYVPDSKTKIYFQFLRDTDHLWDPFITMYQSIVLLFVIYYVIFNFTKCVSHLIAILTQLMNFIYQVFSPAIRKMGAKSLDFSGVFNHINLIKADQNNKIEDFVINLLSGTDGIDGRIGQSIVLKQTVIFANVLKKPIEEYIDNPKVKKDEKLDNLKKQKLKLDNLIDISEKYLENFNEDFKTLEEINNEIKKAIRTTVKKGTQSAVRNIKSQISQS